MKDETKRVEINIENEIEIVKKMTNHQLITYYQGCSALKNIIKKAICENELYIRGLLND